MRGVIDVRLSLRPFLTDRLSRGLSRPVDGSPQLRNKTDVA